MKRTLLLIGSFAALLTISCTSGGASADGDSLNSTTTKKTSKSEVKISDCLEIFDYDYGRMVTIEDIEKHHDIDLSIIEKEDGGIKGEYGSTTYTWPSDRPDIDMKISTMTMKVPDINTVGIKMLSFYNDSSAETVESFSMGYKKLSEEDLERLNANLEKSYSDPAKLEQVKDLLMSRENMNFELVEDLGTRAYWRWKEQLGGELVTLVGRSKFTIFAKISDDPDQNLMLAKKLAQEVIRKCN